MKFVIFCQCEVHKTETTSHFTSVFDLVFGVTLDPACVAEACGGRSSTGNHLPNGFTSRPPFRYDFLSRLFFDRVISIFISTEFWSDTGLMAFWPRSLFWEASTISAKPQCFVFWEKYCSSLFNTFRSTHSIPHFLVPVTLHFSKRKSSVRCVPHFCHVPPLTSVHPPIPYSRASMPQYRTRFCFSLPRAIRDISRTASQRFLF